MHRLASSPSHRKPIAGIPCDFLSHGEFLDCIQHALSTKNELIHIVTLNAEMVVEAQKNSLFREMLNHSTLNIPDGSSLLWARTYVQHKTWILLSFVQFLFSQEQPLTGIDSIFDICAVLERKTGTAYLFGGEEADRNTTATILQQQYPALTVRPIDSIENLTPGVIFVALGAPKQTIWIEEHRSELEQHGIMIAVGVGGAFAMISKRLPRAPRILRTLHLEWLWRLVLEPRRIKRIWNAVVVFPSLVRGYPH